MLLVGFEFHLRMAEAAVQFLPDQPGRIYGVWPGKHGTNRHGFHDREWPTDKPAGEKRVVVVGDSMTWGTGGAGDTWTRIAEEELGEGWRIINLSTYGYDAQQERATLQATGSFNADLVAIAAYWNDFIPTRVIELGGRRVFVASDRWGHPRLRKYLGIVRAWDGMMWPAEDVSTAEDDLAAAWAGIAHDVLPTPVFVWVIPPQALSAGIDRCQQPARGRCRAALDLTERLGATAEALHLPHGEALPALQAHSNESFYDTPTDWEHPNAAGRRVIGEAFAKALVAPGLLPSERIPQ